MDPSLFPQIPAQDLVQEADALGEPDAGAIASFLARPTCAALRRVLDTAESGGPWSGAAWAAATSALAETLAAATPERATSLALAARDLVGCLLSDRASLTTALVKTRNLLHDLAHRCRTSPRGDPVERASCEAVLDLLANRTLPLPWPDASGGDLLYTMPPTSLRQVGVHLTPPFALVLAAGRLGVFDQPILAPGVLATPETRVEWVLDLRQRHRPDDVVLALKAVLETRKPVILDSVPVVFFVVDRATPTAEAYEVLLALTAVSDAVGALALTVPGRPDPVFLPVNYWITDRILMDPTGRGRAFGRDPALVVRLAPFRAEVAYRDRTEVVELSNGQAVDLRSLYRAALALVGDEVSPSARVVSEGPVPVNLLAGVIEVLSFRVPDAALETPGAFRAVAPLRGRDARPTLLCSVVVVAPPD